MELQGSASVADAYFYSGVCYEQLGKHDKAQEYFKQVIMRWPDYKYARDAEFMIKYPGMEVPSLR